MILHDLTIKRANIDMLKGTAAITFEADLSQEILDNRFRLADFAENGEKVMLRIFGEQLSLLPDPPSIFTVRQEQPEPEPEPAVGDDPECTGAGASLEDDINDIFQKGEDA